MSRDQVPDLRDVGALLSAEHGAGEARTGGAGAARAPYSGPRPPAPQGAPPAVLCSPEPQAAASQVAGCLAPASRSAGSALTSLRAEFLLRAPQGSPRKDREKKRGAGNPLPAAGPEGSRSRGPRSSAGGRTGSQESACVLPCSQQAERSLLLGDLYRREETGGPCLRRRLPPACSPGVRRRRDRPQKPRVNCPRFVSSFPLVPRTQDPAQSILIHLLES